MLKGGQLWLGTSRLTNSITVSAVSANSGNECELGAFRAHSANNGGTEKVTKCVRLVIAWYDQFW